MRQVDKGLKAGKVRDDYSLRNQVNGNIDKARGKTIIKYFDLRSV